MLIVDTDVVRVERRLRAGELTCPSCGAALAPWGHGRPREIRGDLGSRLFVRPRRSRCTGCRVTHVLLPEEIWPRRMDTAEVIGAGLEIAALGMGHRRRRRPPGHGGGDGPRLAAPFPPQVGGRPSALHCCSGRSRGRSGDGQIEHLTELNRLFTAWVETVYHRTVHSETGQPPIERWLGSIPRPLPLPSPADLREAFLWSEFRTVTKTATVSLHGNSYEVDPMLSGMRVELVFDPFDLTEIEVRASGRTTGKAVPHRVGRHTHPKASPETPAEPALPTGIDYLKILDETHTANTAKGINYSSLLDDGRGRQ
ncbi:Mu transposase C-terminal domain-containing protein [Streptomyces sp. NPDC047974]|uniref:Mu transposase C-terminal domain-containing protein n=1 Tax=Streptomyces sp. NPDC047974 TaxID=3154343 RepID=UPI0033E27C80